MKNFEIKNIESGRSMIEMLGVLAIIGVLSVGGIAGYSKSMQKYRINKTIEQVSQISQNIRTFFAPQRDFSDLDSTTADGKKLVQKAKLIPDENIPSPFFHLSSPMVSINKAQNQDFHNN